MADGSPAVRTTTVDRSEERVGGWIRAWRLAAAVFIAYPLARIVLDPTEPVTAALALAATGLFAFIAFRLGRRSPDDPRRADPRMTAVVLAIIGLAAATCLRSPEPGWVVLFYYGSSAASFIAPDRRAMSLIVIAGLAAGLSLLPIEDVVSAIVQGVAVSVIGVTIFSLTALRRTNARLRAARQELAHVAVASERDRIARDLHDTLGHSLSLIAIKSELARRLLPDDPERARVEIADVERVARESLASVRVAVRGGLHPTLAGELAAAREVLDAGRCRRSPGVGRPRGRHESRAAQRRQPRRDHDVARWRRVRPRGARRRRRRRFGARSFEWVRTGRPSTACRHGRRSPRGRRGGGPRLSAVRRGARRAVAPRRIGLARMIRVLLAEDQAMVRGAMAALLSMEADIEVIAQVASGEAAVQEALAMRPDVAVLDIEMPGLDGLAAAAALRTSVPHCRVLIVTTFGRPGYLRQAMEAGALGFVLKDAPADELASAIRSVAVGRRVVDPDLALEALSEGANPLSDREREVLAAATEQATVAEIATAMSLSEGTVRNHLSAAIQKTGARNRGEAARIARDKGWLEPEQ
jgi:DNA-binding NarL/FixJ family response regulator